jgi:low affinity Fe/Cu permease
MKMEMQAAEERVGAALEKLEQALGRIEAQYEAMNAKIDRIVAAVEEDAKEEVSASASGRKTVSPVIANLLAKSGVEHYEGTAVEKALSGLSVEQRIAVKAELARAGVLG